MSHISSSILFLVGAVAFLLFLSVFIAAWAVVMRNRRIIRRRAALSRQHEQDN